MEDLTTLRKTRQHLVELLEGGSAALREKDATALKEAIADLDRRIALAGKGGSVAAPTMKQTVIRSSDFK